MRKSTLWVPTWPHTNQAVQTQKMARGLKFRNKVHVVDTIYVAKIKTLISFAVTAKLICVLISHMRLNCVCILCWNFIAVNNKVMLSCSSDQACIIILNCTAL